VAGLAGGHSAEAHAPVSATAAGRLPSHPDARQPAAAERGRAAPHAGQRPDLAAQTQVIVAGQTGTAIRIHRSAGIRDAETQVQLQRRQPG
jgi:hypothetical protein